jgi:serine/threonine protein kinase
MPFHPRDLNSVITRGEPMPEEIAVALFGQILDAVAYAHNEGVQHRDLKPGNIRLDENGVLVSDWGFGVNIDWSERITVTDVGFGTPPYSPPEQFLDAKSATKAADVHALGIIFSLMLTGDAVPGDEIDYTEIPIRFRFMIMKAVQHKPGHRYPTAEEMRGDFVDAHPTGPAEAEQLGERLRNGETAAAGALLRLLVENPNDVVLYLDHFAQMPSSVLEPLASANQGVFGRIVQMLDSHLEGQVFPAQYVQRLAFFLKTAHEASDDSDVHKLVLRRLGVLADEHESDYPIERFAELCDANFNKPRFPGLVAVLLHDEPRIARRVAPELRELELPEVVASELTRQAL